jgi:hypothetical protein
METGASIKPNTEVPPRKVVIVLLESLLSGEVEQFTSFRSFCDWKKDEEGNLVFGEPSSALRRGELSVHALHFLTIACPRQ